MDGLPEIFLVGCFIGGLKEEIRLEVKLKTPKNLTEAIGMALLVEEKFNLQRRGYTSQRFSALPAPKRSTTTQGILGPNEENIRDTQEHNPDDSLAEISFHAISGSINPQTLRLPGKIKKQGGGDIPFKVVDENREHATCTGRVRNLTIVIQGYVISIDFFVLLVAACPILLGVQWLKTLGPVEMEYEQLTIWFRLVGSSHKLRGLKGFKLTALKAHELMGIQCVVLLLQITPVPTKILPKRTPCPVIQQVLTQFATVFQNPTTLPPKRFQDHGIPLLLGSRPVSTRPYRQPYLQKAEIKKQVRELLQQGLI
ncbi:transposon ty3-G gag-pol polyprotein [Tanacetum coccineum]